MAEVWVVAGLAMVAVCAVFAAVRPRQRWRYVITSSTGLLLLGAGLWGGRGGLRWLPLVFAPPVAAIAYGVALARRDRSGPG